MTPTKPAERTAAKEMADKARDAENYLKSFRRGVGDGTLSVKLGTALLELVRNAVERLEHLIKQQAK
jgi:hypothetical protein